jgi:hypothetical protein
VKNLAEENIAKTLDKEITETIRAAEEITGITGNLERKDIEKILRITKFR